MARSLGPERLRELIEAEFTPPAREPASLAGVLTFGTGARLDIPVFASGLDPAGLLREID